MTKKTILVTGAAGFMGGHLVDYLINNGHKVTGVDDLSGGFLANVNPKSDFFQLDLRNRKKTAKLIGKLKPKLIYHLAADASEGRSQFTPISATERNYLAYIYTLVPAIEAGVAKVVFTSSMSVYGAQKPPFSEDMDTKPVDIYGISKSAMEATTKILSKVHNFTYTIIRPHNVYGPKQNLSDPYRNVVGIFINSLLRKKSFYIYGDGSQKRAFSYIDDVTASIIKAGLLTNCNGEIINIGAGPADAVTIRKLGQIILTKFFNGKVPAKFTPIHTKDRPQEVKEAYCTCQKAEGLLGHQTQTPLDVGIAKTVSWAKSVGPAKPKYLKKLELQTADTPQTWVKHLI